MVDTTSKDTIMLLADKYDYISKGNMTEGIVINKNKSGYTFEKNNTKVTNKDEIIDILRKLKIIVPNYYSELIKSPSLKELASEIESKQAEKEEQANSSDILLNDTLKAMSTPQEKTEPAINPTQLFSPPGDLSAQQGFYLPGDLTEETRKGR